MNGEAAMADVIINDVDTSMESWIQRHAAAARHRRLLSLMEAAVCMHEQAYQAGDARRRRGAIRDRAWHSDVKPV